MCFPGWCSVSCRVQPPLFFSYLVDKVTLLSQPDVSAGVWSPFPWGGNTGPVAGRLSPAHGLSCCTAEITCLYPPETTEELTAVNADVMKWQSQGCRMNRLNPLWPAGWGFMYSDSQLLYSEVVLWPQRVSYRGFCCPSLLGTLCTWRGLHGRSPCALYLMYCIGHLLLQAKAVCVLKFLTPIGHL